MARMDEQHQLREQVVRRACTLMGWPYCEQPVWSGLRRVALAEAVVVSLERLTELLDEVERLRGEEVKEKNANA